MEIINNEEEIDKLSQGSNFQTIKVCLLGIDNTGKSSFLDRIFYRDSFKNFKESIQRNMPTTGANYRGILVKYKGKLFKLDLWDTAGQLRYFHLISFFYKDAHVILNFYDPFKKESFEYVKDSFEIVNYINSAFLCRYILIKNKYDLNETKDKNIMISDEEILEYADKNNLSFRNLSNLEKYNSGIEEIFEDCINGYLNKNNNNL